mmetsp:Transcript_16690/g.27253  ORF Transcript_16690/g.27253 Transcript_16690/m.27253 type:complete len:413 (+) Transcript_16690:299-1537(+)
MLSTTPGGEDEIVKFEVGDKVFPFGDLDQVIIAELQCLGEHALLHLIQLLGNSLSQIINANINLFTTETNHQTHLFVLQITRTNLDTDWHTLLLPMSILPTGVVDRTIIQLASNILILQLLENASTIILEVLQWMLLTNNGHNHRLQWGNLRGQDQSGIISMDHNHNTNSTSGQSPTRLPCNLSLALFILIIDIKHLTKVLSQMMTRGTLNRTSSHWHIRLYRSSRMPTGKLLLLSLVPRNNRHSQQLLINPTIQIQRLPHHNIRILKRRMCRMTLLPQKLPRSQKRGGVLKLPPNHITPLIQLEGQIPMTSNPIGKRWVHDSFTSWPHGNWCRQIPLPTLGNPCHLGGEPLHMILLLFQSIFTNKHWKIGIFYIQFTNLDIEPILNQFPNFVTPWTQNVTSGYIVIGDHFG